jgi:DNA-binding NarL/FixJ family response regulator
VTAGAAPRIRVFVVDDHAVVRLGLRTFLDAVPDVVLVGEATGGRAALERLDRLAEHGNLPHVVLMDLVMRTIRPSVPHAAPTLAVPRHRSCRTTRARRSTGRPPA